MSESTIHETAVVDQGAILGRGCKVWHFSHIMKGAELGENCNIGQNVVVSPGVKLGKNVKVQNNVSIYSGVLCEDHVFIGPSAVFTNIINPRSEVVRRGQYSKTLVKTGASIGANSTILCGNELGEYCFVAAGSVVTKDVQPYSLVMGNPAVHVGWMSKHGHRLDFKDGKAICPEGKDEYELINGEVRAL